MRRRLKHVMWSAFGFVGWAFFIVWLIAEVCVTFDFASAFGPRNIR
jgi:hypothetical protein